MGNIFCSFITFLNIQFLSQIHTNTLVHTYSPIHPYLRTLVHTYTPSLTPTMTHTLYSPVILIEVKTSIFVQKMSVVNILFKQFNSQFIFWLFCSLWLEPLPNIIFYYFFNIFLKYGKVFVFEILLKTKQESLFSFFYFTNLTLVYFLVTNVKHYY